MTYRFMPLALLVLAGCTTLPDDLGRSDVDALAEQRGRYSAEAASEQARMDLVSQLASAPLQPDDAVRIALLNNAELQASYAQLGFAAADVYEAGRIRNPVFVASVMDPNVAGEINQITLGLAASFTDLLTLPARKRLSTAAFTAMQASVGAEIMRTAAEAESAWFGYAGAQQVEALRRQLALAAQLSAELAGRYFDAGNINARELALERAAASEARIHALHAAAETHAARTQLALLMGLSSNDAWTVPGQLNLPLEQEDDLNDLLQLAEASRLDLAAARTEADLLADQLGVVNWTRWLGELEVGVEHERETDGARLTGPGLAWEIPIFTQNRDQQLRAEAELKMAVARVQGLLNAVDNEVRLAHADVLNARQRVSEFREVLIPQRIETVARAQEEVNFMLIGVFELLAMKQEEYSAYQEYLEAVRDYWQARTQLAMAVGRTLPSSASSYIRRINTAELLQATPSETDHSGHGAEPMDHSRMDHDDPAPETMNHQDMNHEDMNHEEMDHEEMDHKEMDHGDMN
ncbi:MAG TPA: TolC family protein, partial [Xanthomonadales bacterium]|nr:TolC family protein [Xanthomonadales bacterium]